MLGPLRALLASTSLPLFALLTTLLASGCHVTSFRQSHPYERVVEIDISPDDALDLSIGGDLTDVVVKGGAAQPRAVVVVRERHENAGQVLMQAAEQDAYASVESFVYRAFEDDDDGFIDRIELWLPREVDDLTITTALGDVEVSDLAVQGSLKVLVDLGDVALERIVAGEQINVETRLGDLDLAHLAGPLQAVSNLGDVRVERIDSPTATITTELGDLTLIACRVTGPFEYRTGLGDTTVREAGAFVDVEAPVWEAGSTVY